MNSWLREDPDKEPFKPKLQTDIRLVFNRSFTNLKKNPTGSRKLKNKAEKLMQSGNVEGFLKSA